MATPSKKKSAPIAACRVCGKTTEVTVRRAWDESTRYQLVEHRDYRDQLRCPGSRLEADARMVRAVEAPPPTPSPGAAPSGPAVEVPRA